MSSRATRRRSSISCAVDRLCMPLLCAAAATACDAAGDPSGRPELEPAQYRVAEPGLYRVSEGAGPDGFYLSRLEPGGKGAVLLPGDTAAVFDHLLGSVILIGPKGDPAGIVGRRGEGPGEFGDLLPLIYATPDGGFAVHSAREFRVAWFTRSGRLVEDVRVAAGGFADGWLEGVGPFWVRVESRRPAGIPLEPTLVVIAPLDAPGDTIVWPGPVPNAYPELPYEYVDSRGVTDTRNATVQSDFNPELLFAGVGAEIVVADPMTGLVSAYDRSGARREVYRFRGERVPLDDAAVERYIDSFWGARMLQNLCDGCSRPRLREVTRESLAFIGDHLPVWRAVLPDPSGRIWLLEGGETNGSEPEHWRVIGLDGSDFGVVQRSPVGSVMAVRGERVLLFEADSLGVPWVSLHAVEPIGAAPPLGRGPLEDGGR